MHRPCACSTPPASMPIVRRCRPSESRLRAMQPHRFDPRGSVSIRTRRRPLPFNFPHLHPHQSMHCHRLRRSNRHHPLHHQTHPRRLDLLLLQNMYPRHTYHHCRLHLRRFHLQLRASRRNHHQTKTNAQPQTLSRERQPASAMTLSQQLSDQPPRRHPRCSTTRPRSGRCTAG